jgi:probable HAF family extracellular repeat protein
MPRFLRTLTLGLCVVVAHLAYTPTASARQYSLTPIPIGDFDTLSAWDLNNAGQVAGELRRNGAPASEIHGYVWSAASGLTDLGAGLSAIGIGSQGTVVGPTFSSDPFIWTPTQGVRQLTSLPGGDVFRRSNVWDVNGAGQVLGWSSDAQHRAFVYNPNGTVRVLPLPAEADGLPFEGVEVVRLTEAGDVLGWITYYRGGTHAIHGAVWPAAGGVRLLDDLPGGPIWSAADGMNSRGQIAGSGFNETGGQRPVVWAPDGRIVDLGLLPGWAAAGASGINEAGEVVGWAAGIGSGVDRAFVWTESEGLLDLSTLLDGSGAGWTLNGAQAINDLGQIVVIGSFDGHFTAALLTPVVPEPASLGLLGIAALTAGGRRRGRSSRTAPDYN